MRVTKSIVRTVAVLLLLALCSSEAVERKHLKATVEPGGEVLICTHKRFDKLCRPRPVPHVEITRPPANGTVTLRPGTYVIENTWHPEAEDFCRGQSVPGIGIYYRANPTFRGGDTFEYEVTLGIQHPITYGVDVQVNVK